MQDAVADYVHPIFDYGMKLLERLESGAPADFDAEQGALTERLRAERVRAKRLRGKKAPVDGEANFDPIRYALTCWLDEMFIQHSSWSEAWAKNKLEAALFGTDQGTQKFWQEACAAQEQTATDALEVFFLCVQFGFRGAWRDSQDQVDRWVAAAKNRLSSAPTKARPSSVELEPVTDVPPLHGLRQMKRMVLVCGVCFLVLIPLVVFLLARHY